MKISIFDLFKIGIGPSSSHTVGPMKASKRFLDKLHYYDLLKEVTRVEVTFYGSLALTGKGHGTFAACILGLAGYIPETVDPAKITAILKTIQKEKKIYLDDKYKIDFSRRTDILAKRKETLTYHTNGMIFKAYKGKELIKEKTYYSIGGGFVVGENTAQADQLIRHRKDAPHLYNSGKDLLRLCKEKDKSISEIVFENELAWNSEEDIEAHLRNVWSTMESSISNGLKRGGKLPGSLGVKRRAKQVYNFLKNRPEESLVDPLSVIDWVNLYALAVNEENASYGRVVTAPTNGAAGIIPAVMMYYKKFCPTYTEVNLAKLLLTAGAIGILYKKNASISGAEVGCQGEVGVACSMAAAGLTEVLGGTPEQVENAAEIAMEHNLGLTCDPIGGLVQIPCIERNAMAAVKAINATRMALRGNGKHFVSLDDVMKTMLSTGKDMQAKYKETALGGLAVCVTEC